MSTPRLPNQKTQYKKLNERLSKYMASVLSIYESLNKEAAKIALSTDYDGTEEFSFDDYPITKDRVQKLQQQFVSDLGGVIMSGTSEEWKNSNLLQDMIADKVLGKYVGEHKGKEFEHYYQKNSGALKAFQQRKDKGLNLSQKLWNQSADYKTELEEILSVSIEKGIDAVTLSKRVSKYLWDFPSMQAAYEEKFGHASRAKNCEYRSIRLARSEINMAYRTAEQERWRQFDFVVGYEIKLSGSHPVTDVCDDLKGKYPKDFVWTGWHPNCMCYCVPLLMSEDEFFADKEEVDEEIKGIADGSKVEEALKGKSFMFETSEVFVGQLDLKNREAIDKLAYKLGKFNPQGEVKSFSIEDIIQTQQYVGTQNVIDIAKSIEKNGLQDNPTGIQVGGKVFVVDGHNRIAALRLSGSNTFDLRVVEVSESEWRDAGGMDPIGGYVSSKKKNGSITKSSNKVTDVPKQFKEWIDDNLFRAKGWSNTPYFVRDNSDYVREDFKVDVYTDTEKKFIRKGRTRLAMSRVEYYLQANPNIGEVQQAAVNAYTQAERVGNKKANYREINKRLRRETEDEYVDVASELISKCIKQLPKVQGTVYRGEEMSMRLFNELYLSKQGDIVTMKGFTSASRLQSVTETFHSRDGIRKSHSRVVIEIKSKRGRDISSISEFNGKFNETDQKEVLFDYGSRFRIVSIEEIDVDNKMYQLFLEEV